MSQWTCRRFFGFLLSVAVLVAMQIVLLGVFVDIQVVLMVF